MMKYRGAYPRKIYDRNMKTFFLQDTGVLLLNIVLPTNIVSQTSSKKIPYIMIKYVLLCYSSIRCNYTTVILNV